MTSRQIAALATKKKLLDAGSKIIAEKGLSQATVDEITALAGVSKGTFYTYFKKKEDIVFALGYGAFSEVLDKAMSLQDTFIEKIIYYMVHFSAYIEDSGYKLSQEWIRSLSDISSSEETGPRGKLKFDLDSISRLIQAGVEEGNLAKDTPAEVLTHTLADILYGQMFCWSVSDGSYSLRARTEEFCETCLPEIFKAYAL
ncbi:TetR/AcrR family transcriptional regulator [Emergencia sp. JLR.KK010]|uniref:TetR/AcrR family transcriptional regulator n=1 Tax=Emergencia sp. JLR.KK010 TaxID=3114296 RepID=UPI0030CB96FB